MEKVSSCKIELERTQDMRLGKRIKNIQRSIHIPIEVERQRECLFQTHGKDSNWCWKGETRIEMVSLEMIEKDRVTVS